MPAFGMHIAAAIMCSVMSNSANGLLIIDYNTSEVHYPAFEVGATARYQCFPGNGFNTSSSVIVITPVRTCQSDTDSSSGVHVDMTSSL